MNHQVPAEIVAWLPKAIAWAKSQEERTLTAGRPLSDHEIALADRVGVVEPDRIRLHIVDNFPRPEDDELRQVAAHMGFFSPGMIGLTLGYGVLVAAEHQQSDRLLRHEFRHVHQYEAATSFEGFLSAYLSQIVEFGYPDAPLEIDARRHEAD